METETLNHEFSYQLSVIISIVFIIKSNVFMIKMRTKGTLSNKQNYEIHMKLRIKF